jgi:ParB-like nuclease family protein
MKRITVALKDLKPNPFKIEITDGYISPQIVAQIKESATATSFWEQWVVRENSWGEYELAFGHHRRAAAIELFGENHEVSVQLEDYTDDQMFIAMADENAGSGHLYVEVCNVVSVARDRIIEDPTRCKLKDQLLVAARPANPSPKRGRRSGEQGCAVGKHGSAACVSAYLGEVNWSLTRVKELLQLEDGLDRSILTSVTPGASWNGSGEEELRHKDALTISQLEKPVQKVAAEILKRAGKKKELTPVWQIRKAVELAKEDAVRKAEPEQCRAVKAIVADTLNLPEEKQSAVAESIVDEINSAPTARKKRAAVKRVLKEENIFAKEAQIDKIVASASEPLAEAQSKTVLYALERQVEEARAVKLPTADDEGLRIIDRLMAFLPDGVPDEKVQTLIAGRGYLKNYVRHCLIKVFDEIGNRFRGYAEELAKPLPKRLTEGDNPPAPETDENRDFMQDFMVLPQEVEDGDGQRAGGQKQ